MRPRYLRLLLIAALAQGSSVKAQDTNCDTELRSQTEVDAFDCASISELRIQGSDITNLGGLSELASVSGGIIIFENDALTSLSGLGALTSVGSFRSTTTAR